MESRTDPCSGPGQSISELSSCLGPGGHQGAPPSHQPVRMGREMTNGKQDNQIPLKALLRPVLLSL